MPERNAEHPKSRGLARRHVNTCEYCGKPAEGESLVCAGCGSPREFPKNDRVSSPAAKRSHQRPLDAKTAAIIFLCYLATQTFCGFVASAIAEMRVPAGVNYAAQFELQTAKLMPATVIADSIFSAAALVFLVLRFAPGQIKDTAPTGAAWVRGPWAGIAKGLLIGLIIGMANQLFVFKGHHFVAHRDLDDFSRMANTPGVARTTWLCSLLLFAPVFEEMLFRGILYGGFRRSFGAIGAAYITTILFVALHFPYYMHDPTMVIGFFVGALVLLWCRLHWRALGPGIAAHFGYNLTAALVAVYWTSH